MALNYPGSFSLADSPSADAFGRQRVSDPTTMLDLKLVNGINAARWIQDTATSGTIAATSPLYGATLTATASSGSRAYFQSRQRGIYQPGKSLMVQMTFNFNVAGNGTANVRKRVGMFDENDGIFLEQNGTDVRLVLRTSTSGSPSDSNAVTKANWNLDKLDGTGQSGLTIDFTKTQILHADLQYLGVGRVRVGFVINGVLRPVHEFNNANVLTVPYMANPNLPVRYECESTAASAGSTLLAICASIISEGGFDVVGLTMTGDTDVTARSIGAARNELIAVRLTSANIRKAMLKPWGFSLLQTAQPFHWELLLNPTGVTRTVWTSPSDSVAEYCLDGTGTVSGGTLLGSGYVSTNQDAIGASLDSVLAVGQLNLTPTSEILSLCVTTVNATAQSYYGSLFWRELY